MKLLVVFSFLFSTQVFAGQCWKAQSKMPPKWEQVCFDNMQMQAPNQNTVNLVVSKGMRAWELPVVAAASHGGSIKFKAEGPYKEEAQFKTKLEYFGSIDEHGGLSEMDKAKIRVIFAYFGKPQCAQPNEEGNCEVWYDYVK